MSSIWYYIEIIRISAIYFLIINIISSMIYTDSYYETVGQYYYKHSIFRKINDWFLFSNNWKHFAGPVKSTDARIYAIIKKDEHQKEIVLYDPEKNICWIDHNINMLDKKWYENFEYEQGYGKINATYDYLERMYPNADEITIYAHIRPMNGFHASEETNEISYVLNPTPENENKE